MREDRGVCETCGNAGRVIVPGSSLMTVGGQVMPSGVSCAVLCHCPIGRSYGSASGKGPSMMSWEQYTRAKPYWRDEADADEDAMRLRLGAPPRKRREQAQREAV